MIELCDTCVHCSMTTERSPVFCNENIDIEHHHAYCTFDKGFVHPPEEYSNYKSREKVELERHRETVTHKGMIEACRKYAVVRGWSSFTYTDIRKKPDSNSYPDLLLWKQGQQIRALEVKSAKATRTEVRCGLGQCMWYLLSDLIPYLVVHERFASEVTSVLNRTGCPVGLISYDSTGLIFTILGEPL